MTRKILPPSQKNETVHPSWKQELLTNYACQVYPRVSSPEQKKNVSAEMQQDKSFAVLCGWVDDGELIVMDKDDLGLSGQLRMEERPAFVKLLRRIADGTIKTVIAAQVDRLFRDRWGAEYSKFMEICYTYGVKVVTPNPWRTGIDFIYDFSIPWHVDKFRRKCEEAWSYLENHVYGRMLAAQRELGESGYWAAGNIPIGYISDRREKIDGKKNPNHRKYIPYEPHAQIVRWLFVRYRDLAGQINELLREIERLPYLFPACDASVDVEIISRYANKKVFGEDGKTIIGYTIASDRGLRGLLSNPAYVGYRVYNNMVVSSDNHESIVDYGLFLYAFNRLSPYHLDGSPNEPYLEKRKRYVKKHKADKPALLKNHIQASDEGYVIRPCDIPLQGEKTKGSAVVFYGFYPRKSGVRPSAKYMIPAIDIDGFFLDRFIERLQNADEFDDFLSQESAEQQAQLQLQKDIERDIKADESQMAKIEKQVEVGELTDLDLQKKANATYRGLKEDLVRLRERLREVTTNKTQAQKRRSYQQLMQEAGECWDEVVTPEEIPLMIDTFVDKVVVEPLSPRFYTMSIHWFDPEWGIDIAVCFRDGNPSLRWTQDEDELLKLYYQKASQEELLLAIPTRSFQAMTHRAITLGLTRQIIEPTSVPPTMCWQDYRFMLEHGLTQEQMQAEQEGTKAKRRWSEDEDELLIQYYPKAPREELLQVLPNRNYRTMIYRAGVLGLVRQVYEPENVPHSVCWQDFQIMLECGLTEDQLRDGKGGKLIAWSIQLPSCTAPPGQIPPCLRTSARLTWNSNNRAGCVPILSLIGACSPPLTRGTAPSSNTR